MLSGMVSLTAGAILKLALADAVTVPDLAVMSMGELPPAAVGAAVTGTVMVSFAVAGAALSVSLAGANVPVAPVGRPVTVRSASPLKVFGSMLTVMSTLSPRFTSGVAL